MVAAQQLPPQTVYLLSVCGHAAVIGYVWLGDGPAVAWQPWGLAAALGAGLSMAVGLLFFFKALAGGEAAVVVPLTALYPLVTVILSWAVLRESLTPRHLAGLAPGPGRGLAAFQVRLFYSWQHRIGGQCPPCLAPACHIKTSSWLQVRAVHQHLFSI